MFAQPNDKELQAARYERALRLKPNVPGVLAHQLGWVVERKGITEVLVSFRGLENLVREFAEADVVEVAPVEVAEDQVKEEVVETKRKGGRRVTKEVSEDTNQE